MTPYVLESVLGTFLIGSVVVLFFFGVLMAWVFTLFDMFARSDLKGWQKAAWLLAVIILPLLGTLAYLVLRPKDAHWYGRSAFEEPADPNRDWQISEVQTLVRLRNQGTITDDEFERMKTRVIAA